VHNPEGLNHVFSTKAVISILGYLETDTLASVSRLVYSAHCPPA